MDHNVRNSIGLSSTSGHRISEVDEENLPNDISRHSVQQQQQCGLLQWRPDCLKRAATIRTFLPAACLISCLQAAFSGYTASQVTTLEKRFGIGSGVIGIINSFFEMGYILSVVFVSYLGSRGNVPLCIATGLFLMAIGAFLWTLPHFLHTHNVLLVMEKLASPICHRSSIVASSNETGVLAQCKKQQTGNYDFLPFLLAQFLMGVGSSPILTLVPPFIDDHVPANKAPPMIASQYAAAAMGPVFGFALGAGVLLYPEQLFTPTKLQPTDQKWIGAWWVGFIFLGILVLIGSFVLLLFPRRLNNYSRPIPGKLIRQSTSLSPHGNGTAGTSAVEKKGTTGTVYEEETVAAPPIDEDTSTVQSTRRLPWSGCSPSSSSRSTCAPHIRCPLFDSPDKVAQFSHSVLSLIRNRVYLMVCLCICSEMFMIVGFASFLPKYLEMEYGISKSAASMIAGGLIVPSGSFGILVGGLVLHRFHFHRRGAIRFVLVVNLFILASIISFFFLGCKNPPVAGITVDYPDWSKPVSLPQTPHWLWSIFGTGAQGTHSVTATCNGNCDCDAQIWSPVCHVASEITYISPCLAGCRTIIPANISEPLSPILYGNCSCFAKATDQLPVTLRGGPCPLRCNRLIPFIVVLTTCLFLTGVIQNPLLMVTMRSVEHDERSFALGLQFVIIRLLANLPSPIVFGRVIDGACRLWRTECGVQGDCAFEDLRKLNLYMSGLGGIIKCVGLVFYILLLYLLRGGLRQPDTIIELQRISFTPNGNKSPGT